MLLMEFLSLSLFSVVFVPTCRKIVERIDTDKDGFVSHAELHYWIKHRQRRYIQENVDKHWKDYDMNKDGKISWEEYKNTTYGFYQGKTAATSAVVISTSTIAVVGVVVIVGYAAFSIPPEVLSSKLMCNYDKLHAR